MIRMTQRIHNIELILADAALGSDSPVIEAAVELIYFFMRKIWQYFLTARDKFIKQLRCYHLEGQFEDQKTMYGQI